MIELPSLHPHQSELKDKVCESFKRHRNLVMCVPTGTGKTRLSKWMLGKAVNRDRHPTRSGSVLFAVHRRGLVENASNSFNEDPPLPHGIIMSQRETHGGRDLQVASIDTILSWFCEAGEYRSTLTYDFIVFDECVSGDSIIDTELGEMRIDEVPSRRPKTVRSMGGFQAIEGWKFSGIKQTIKVHTDRGSFSCTPEHEVYTDRGWIKAGDLTQHHKVFVSADVVNQQRPNLDIQESMLTGTVEGQNVSATVGAVASRRQEENIATGTGEEPRNNCVSFTTHCSTTHRCVNAGAVKKSGSYLRRLKHGCPAVRRRKHTGSFLGTTRSITLTKRMHSRKVKRWRFSARCLATRQYHFQRKDLGRLDYMQHTASASETGQSTRRIFLQTLGRLPAPPPTKDGATRRYATQVHASRASETSTRLSCATNESSSLEFGLIESATSVWRGGLATMGLVADGECSYIQRGSVPKRMRLLRRGYRTTTARQRLSITTLKARRLSTSQAGRRSKSATLSETTSQSVCNTNWSRVVSIEPGKVEAVYDIAVANTHCFFANNHLVHNCHSHLGKLKKFLAVHNRKREELGLSPPFILGLSATPNAKGLSDVFGEIVTGASAEWLVENGYLNPFRYFQATTGDLSKLVSGGEEFTDASVASAMDGLAGDLVRDWQLHADGRATVGFFPRKTHAKEAMQLLCDAGVRCEYVDGNTADAKRNRMFSDLNSGEIDYICNVGVIERGTDIPRIGCIQLCTCIGSIVRFKQMVGRGARVHPDVPDCIVLDHGGNIRRHGFFEDEVEWTLDWSTRATKDHEAKPSVACPKCKAIYRGGKCKNCGYEPTTREFLAQGLKFDKSELVEITARKKKKREPGSKKSNEQLLIDALYRAGKSGRTFDQAIGMARTVAKAQGTEFIVPKHFEVAGKKFEALQYGSLSSKDRVSATYPFTTGNHRPEANPYFVEHTNKTDIVSAHPIER